MALAGRRPIGPAARPSSASRRRLRTTTPSLVVRAASAGSDSNNSSTSSKKKAPQPLAAAASASATASLSRPPSRPALTTTSDNDNDNDDPVFIDRDGVAIRVMPWDYGFRSGAARTGGVVGGAASGVGPLRTPLPVRVVAATASTASLSSGDESDGDPDAAALDAANASVVRGKVPASLASVARANFRAELFALRASFRRDDYKGIIAAGEGGGGAGAASTAGPLRRAAGAAGAAAAAALARADRALEEAGVLPRLELGPGTTVGAGATSAATAASDDGTEEECVVVEEEAEIEDDACAPAWRRVLRALDDLTLDDHAVETRDRARDAALASAARSAAQKTTTAAPTTRAPLLVRLPFTALCVLLDALYAGRPLQRFWVLETVARVPYFAYISVLHAYESVGLWRAGAELRRVHFAEEYNELHHLQIMESLGGDRLWFDRFVAEHSAVLYYWMLVGLYALAPRQAYRFSELVELHAFDSYDQFCRENETKLKQIPPPLVAARYYRSSETLYMFDGFQDACGRGEREAAEGVLRAGESAGSASTLPPLAGGPAGASPAALSAPRPPRRPPCNNLYDVFINIRDDEAEHVVTMKACADDAVPDL